jgi:BirA family transcriptional regulator, biotin operon repressor / biotin---[acetyl-CoA-carboxylase] ligase
MRGLEVIPWPAEAIWEQIATILPNFTVEVLPEIDSTNSELMRRAKAGQAEPILLIAEKQTAGRGRLGREWHDLGGRATDSLTALTFSLGLPLSPIDWSGLSLAVGVSIAQNLHPSIGLKWPNDLWLSDAKGDRKLAGILIETCAFGDQRYVVIGVGINITQPALPATAQQPALRTPAACLQELLPNITAHVALQQLILPLAKDILLFAERGFAPYQERFNVLDVLKARQVSVDGTVHTEGLGMGVNHKGELLVQTAQGQVAVNSSEVSVRPL